MLLMLSLVERTVMVVASEYVTTVKGNYRYRRKGEGWKEG